jgi:hydrogenase expression/formation protein HypC
VCLAVPGQIVDVVDEVNRLAKVDVAGVQRNVNVGLLDGVGPGDWVLIHVGFAISQVDEGRGLALCEDAGGRRSSVEIALVDPVAVGDELLVHAGTAIASADVVGRGDERSEAGAV